MLKSLVTPSASLEPVGRSPSPRDRVPVLFGILSGIFLAAAVTPFLLTLRAGVDLRDVNILFLIPVTIAATRWGLLPAIATALCSAAVSAFFLYPPTFSFKVLDQQDVLDIAMFIVAAFITSHLAGRAKVHAAAAEQSNRELSLLYAFSRKLALATAPGEIFAAIQDHISRLVGAHVAVFAADADQRDRTLASPHLETPQCVRTAVEELRHCLLSTQSALVTDPVDGRSWLLRKLSRGAPRQSILVVDLGPVVQHELPTLRQRVDALLDDAFSTLERLDVSTALNEAQLRRQSESLREAVIGSVSHGLRTPLASILGSGSILAEASTVANDALLASLAAIIVNEAERLNGDIQKMLDAATLSGTGVKPHPTWMEPTDLINAAAEQQSRVLADHNVIFDLPPNLPLVRVDPMLIVQALCLIIDNAAKYSQGGSTIRIVARAERTEISVQIIDDGEGLGRDELPLVFEKFYRGSRVRETTRGSGLGLWIANAFVTACQGRIGIAVRDDTQGTCVTVHLPAATDEQMRQLGGADE